MNNNDKNNNKVTEGILQDISAHEMSINQTLNGLQQEILELDTSIKRNEINGILIDLEESGHNTALFL